MTARALVTKSVGGQSVAEPRIYRASSLGYSLETLVAPHLGYEAIPPPEWLQAKFDEGSDLEPIVIGVLRERGWFLQDEQLEVELEVIPGVAKVVGHLDGTGHPDSLPWGVVEVKTMAEKSYKDFEVNGWASSSSLITKYKWQASAYMLATGKPHYMVAWNKSTQEIYVEFAHAPFFTISDIANKLQAAEDAIEAGIIPEGCKDYPCPYFYLHPPIDEPEPAGQELDGLLAAWREANRKKKIYEAEEASLREMVKEYVGEIAGKVKGSQGITVSTNWVPEKEVRYVKAGHWETRITNPRERKNGN